MTYDQQVEHVLRACYAAGGRARVGTPALHCDLGAWWTAHFAGRIGGGPNILEAALSLLSRLVEREVLAAVAETIGYTGDLPIDPRMIGLPPGPTWQTDEERKQARRERARRKREAM